ncbi:hypothetical protein [Aliiroseovarius sp.]|uniref:hypothetical protein n=1 Tax=Aliiroseovarius sp. TaxID=1872442 RepID=UPI003BAAA672
MTLRRAFWVVFALMAATYLAMAVGTIPKLIVDCTLPFDIRFKPYDVVGAEPYLKALGAEGRRFYAEVQHALDRVFLGLLAVTLILAYHLLFPRGLAWLLTPLPLVTATFDWLENAAVSVMLRGEPHHVTEAMTAAAWGWTRLKFVAMGLTLAILAAGLWRRRLKRRAA